METHSPVRDQIAAEAVDWHLQLQVADWTEPDQEAFTEWLMQSPAHIEEYLAVSRAWCGLAIPTEGGLSADALIAAASAHVESNNVIALRTVDRPRAMTEERRPQATPMRRWLAGAAMVAALAGAWLLNGYWSSANDLRTAVGEQRSVTLADGSVVFLNTNSELRLRWSARERHIDLLRGEARFQVARNAERPFIVATQEASVRAVGTVFNVRTGEATTQVAVLEGRVEVNAIPTQVDAAANSLHIDGHDGETQPTHMRPDLLLAAGQRAAVTSLGVEPDVGPPIERVAAWTERRLVFRGDPLSAVIAEFNRYRPQALVLDDSSLARIRINGVFELDDPASLVAYLRNFESVRVEQRTDGSEHLSRGSQGRY